MMSLVGSCQADQRLHRQGWAYSLLFHAAIGAGLLALVSGLKPSFETDSFQWNVALVDSQKAQPSPNPLPEVTHQPQPPDPAVNPVQRKIFQRQTVQAAQPVPKIIPINHTVSTPIAQTIHPQDVHEPVAQEEQPAESHKAVAPQEPAPQALTEHSADVPVTEPAPRQAAPEQIVAAAAPSPATPAAKADYGWLMKALLGRINELKNYPHIARINQWEGKVVLRAVIKDDGQVLMVDVQESSGRSILDNDAMETLRKASPLKLEQPLGKPQIAILMPISYSLR